MNEEQRRLLAEYLRFQRELGIDTVRLDVSRFAPGKTEAQAAGADGSASVGAFPANAAASRTTGFTAAEPRRAGGSSGFSLADSLKASRPTASTTARAAAAAAAPNEATHVQTSAVRAGEGSAPLVGIRGDLGDCTRCKLHGLGRKQIVFGTGNPSAELVFVGEAPGADEDEQGIPFVGRAGQLLTDMIQKGMGVAREQVYICNVVKCRPPQNRTPESDECQACSPFLLRQLAAIRPRMICALGAVAAQNLLNYKGSLASVRGRIHDVNVDGYATKLVVTYHPAYLLRDPSQKKEAWKDLQIVMGYLGLTPPARG